MLNHSNNTDLSFHAAKKPFEQANAFNEMNKAQQIETKRLSYIFYSYASLGSLLTFVFALKSILTDDSSASSLQVTLIVSCLFLLSTLTYALLSKNLLLATKLAGMGIALFAISTVATSTAENTELYWLAPLIYAELVLLGPVLGAIAALAPLLLLIIDIIWPSVLTADHANLETSSALLSLLVLAAMGFVSEHYRYHSHAALQGQHMQKVMESLTDLLTQLPNQRFLRTVFLPACKVIPDNYFPMACIICNIEGFNKINKTHGRDTGDLILQIVANLLTSNVRNDDVVCRIEGDEFLLLLQDVELNTAHKIADKLASEIAQTSLPHLGLTLQAHFRVSCPTDYKALLASIKNVQRMSAQV